MDGASSPASPKSTPGGLPSSERYAALTNRSGSVLHQQALTVAGLLTGFTLTSLVLILNSPVAFHISIGPLSGQEYFETVVTYVAMVGATSSVSMLAFLEIAGGLAEKFSYLDKLGTTFFLASVFGFMGVLPLLLAPFTRYGAAAVLVFEVVLLTAYFVGRRFHGPTRESDGGSQ